MPDLKPLKQDPINLVLRNQPPKVLYETVGKVAGINVLFDPDFVQQSNKPISIDITNSTLGAGARLPGHADQGILEAAFPQHHLRHPGQHHQAPRL